MKILVTPRSFGKTDPYAFTMLENAGFEIVKNDTGGILSEESLGEKLLDCDGVILGVDPLTRNSLELAVKLKAIAKYGVGVDNIDMAACEEKGIKVSRAIGANSQAVADYTFALMMAAARRLLPIDALCRKADWSKNVTMDVYGKTLGLIGLGAIGKAVAKRAMGFDMKVLGYDVFWDEAAAKESGVIKADLDTIYREADFISVHAPLTQDTKGMISAPQISLMKPTVILINTARGGIIDEDALLEALKSKRVYGAGIDAFTEEPPKNPEWFSLGNIVIGSHCAASTYGATERMGRMAAANLIRDLRAFEYCT